VTSSRRRHDVDLAIDARTEELRGLLRSVRVLGEGTPRAADGILAMGEILSSEIVAAAFVERELAARLVDARDVLQPERAPHRPPHLGHVRRVGEAGGGTLLGVELGSDADRAHVDLLAAAALTGR
jgi:hypothetical protein